MMDFYIPISKPNQQPLTQLSTVDVQLNPINWRHIGSFTVDARNASRWRSFLFSFPFRAFHFVYGQSRSR
jgi:hypothetical protein